MLKGRYSAISCLIAIMIFLTFGAMSVQAASPWYYSVTGPDGSYEITADKIGQILYFEADATAPDYVWGNVRIDFDPDLLECVSIEETPETDGFWTAWIPQTADLSYGGGGSLYYYDSNGLGSDWAEYWVSQYGSLMAGPSGSYDNSLGVIRLYVMTSAGGLNGAMPLRLGFLVKKAGTAVFNTYANDWTAFGWPTGAASNMSALNSVQASSGQGYSWNIADLPFMHTTVVQIASQACIQPPSGMIGWWPGDGNASDIVSGNNGLMNGGASFASGMVGQAFRFSEDNDRVELGNPATLRLSGGDFTVDAWVRFDLADLNTDGAIVSKMGDDYAANSDGWMLLRQVDNHFWFCFGGGSGNGCTPSAATTVISTTSVKSGTWYHVAGVKNSAEFAIYVNGVMEASKPLPALTDSDTYPAFIGDSRLRHQLLGLIDEVELFNRALNAEEIKTIYLAGGAGKCKNHPPEADGGPDQTVESTSCAGASVTLDGSDSADADGDALTYTWADNGDVIATGVNAAVILSYGSHAITLTVDDGKGGTAVDEVTISVVDTSAPLLSVALSPNVLWPPNHKHVTVTPAITVSDACAETVQVQRLISSSSEPDNGLGDGDTENDIVVNDNGTLSLRAERSGKGTGRVYTITFQATDIGGNSTIASATVTVPQNR